MWTFIQCLVAMKLLHLFHEALLSKLIEWIIQHSIQISARNDHLRWGLVLYEMRKSLFPLGWRDSVSNGLLAHCAYLLRDNLSIQGIDDSSNLPDVTPANCKS